MSRPGELASILKCACPAWTGSRWS